VLTVGLELTDLFEGLRPTDGAIWLCGCTACSLTGGFKGIPDGGFAADSAGLEIIEIDTGAAVAGDCSPPKNSHRSDLVMISGCKRGCRKRILISSLPPVGLRLEGSTSFVFRPSK
jgi:hypothetical protein